MQRFMGMMPSDEIDKSETYIDNYGKPVVIEAGKHGWTVNYCDGSTNYQDIDETVDKNFEKAYNIANENVGPLNLIKGNSVIHVDVCNND